jgi:excisionase family DNA binding protein
MPLGRQREPLAAEPSEQADLGLLARSLAEGSGVSQLTHLEERPTVLRGDRVSIVPVNRLLTTQEAANLLNVSREYVRRLIQKNEIPHVDVGRHQRIPFSDLMTYREKRNGFGIRRDGQVV